jgi:hypothetical protein
MLSHGIAAAGQKELRLVVDTLATWLCTLIRSDACNRMPLFRL